MRSGMRKFLGGHDELLVPCSLDESIASNNNVVVEFWLEAFC
jgi:hypothetical protein